MPPTESDSANARLLVVDDQAENVQLLRQLLVDAGYRHVQGTTDSRRVVPMHDEFRFDLILLDMQMPYMDGFAVMEGIRDLELDNYLPVLVITGNPLLKLRAIEAGARDFVGKPYDVVELQARIRNLLLVRRLYRRLSEANRELEAAVAERTAELLASEARFRGLVELATDFYWETDTQGNFSHVSGRTQEMLGLLAPAREGEAPRWSGGQAALEHKLAQREPFIDLLLRYPRGDGSTRMVQVSGEPTFGEGGRFTGFRGIGADFTEIAPVVRSVR